MKFLADKALPLVGVRTTTIDPYHSVKLPIVTIFTDIDLKKNIKGYQYIANRIRKVAKDYKNKLIFNVADKSMFSYELIDYNIVSLSGKKDVGMGIKIGSMYYKSSKPFSTENLKEFVKEFFAGTLIGKEKVS